MPTLTCVIPCFNEERTLRRCLDRVLAIANETLTLEIIIVDDASTDDSHRIALDLASRHPEVRVERHPVNRGKGAALKTGFGLATGEYVAVQDADLEYDPRDLVRLLEPLTSGQADVVFGSRFIGSESHRVLFFWHSVGNRCLTLLSNMFTDLNLTDMETCYKVFRRELLQSIEIEEERFGFEPEIVAKVAARRVRIFEMGIHYAGRTYEEGKKIGIRDGFRAIYCILRYNAPHAPLPIQFFFYSLLGGLAAVINISAFLLLLRQDFSPAPSAGVAFGLAAAVNYILCIRLFFRSERQRSRRGEIAAYIFLVAIVGLLDIGTTLFLLNRSWSAIGAKITACCACLGFNFLGRRFRVFPSPRKGAWKPQESEED